MQAQRKLRDVCMYIDLHGHSRKYNVFMYGCDDKKKPRPQVRTFPKMLSMHSAGRKYVCYNDCSFAVKKGRESTARVVVSKEINIMNSFTLEATFCGSNYGPLKHCHMNIGHLQEVGSSLCDSILNYFISEGVVKDTVTVPHNVKAVLAFEKIIASEGLGSTNDYSTSYSAGNSGAGGFSSAMYTNNTAGGGSNSGIAEGRERSESNSTEPSSSNKAAGEGRSGEKSGSVGDGSDKSGKCLFIFSCGLYFLCPKCVSEATSFLQILLIFFTYFGFLGCILFLFSSLHFWSLTESQVGCCRCCRGRCSLVRHWRCC